MEKEYSLYDFIPRRSPASRPAIIVQARMGSTRLPGKVMMLMNGTPMLQGMLERLISLQSFAILILATTQSPREQPLVDIASKLGVQVFRGSEEDVLDRYAQAVEDTPADAIVRLTSDCPLIDAAMIDKALDLFYHLHPDYLSNTLHRTYPRGFDMEIFSRKALEIAAKEAVLPSDREHVTLYVVSHPEQFHLVNFVSDEDLSQWRLTVDTKDDFTLVEQVLSNLGKKCTYAEIKTLLHTHPEWLKINAHVKQKQVSQ
jgi:spore coat polysaccharide biosynthesis protein SpsF